MTEEQDLDFWAMKDIMSMLAVPRNANDNLYEPLLEAFQQGELTLGQLNIQRAILPSVEQACQALLDALLIDTEHDHNTKETAKRMAKMYVCEVFNGRYEPKPELKVFPNVKNLDQTYTLGPIDIRSYCSHHFVPIIGHAWVGILPESYSNDGMLLGLSKLSRYANWIFKRPQIQEEATEMLCDAIQKAIKPKGMAVTVRARHLCMTHRGVKEHNTTMVTSALRGAIKDDGICRAEYFNLIKGQGF